MKMCPPHAFSSPHRTTPEQPQGESSLTDTTGYYFYNQGLPRPLESPLVP